MTTQRALQKLTGVPFNDACRYMDWPLTVPLLLIEILSVMKLSVAEFSSKSRTLGLGSAWLIVSGYFGEFVVTGDLTPRWAFWVLPLAFFCYTVYVLLVGLAAATAKVLTLSNRSGEGFPRANRSMMLTESGPRGLLM